MESTIVIKVKYGETLRRFNARIVDEELHLDMYELREKVLSLFNFPPDSDLRLTYIDEDGDVVTLVNEEDLRDVTRQSLNPLRITVRLNTERSGRLYGISSGNSTPMRSPRVQPPVQNLNAGVSEILKSVPEAIRETLSRLSTELASNSTSSTPGYAELIDSLSKMGLTYLKEVSLSGKKSGASGSTIDAPVTKGQNSLKVDGTTPNVVLKSNEAEIGNWTGNSEGLAVPAADFADLNASLRGGKLSFGSSSANPTPGSFDVAGDGKKDKLKKLGEYNVGGNSTGTLMQGRSATNTPSGDKMEGIKKSTESHLGMKYIGVGSSSPDYLNPGTLDSQASELGGCTGTKLTADSGNSLGSHFGLNSFNECPFMGAPLDNNSSVSSVPPRQYVPRQYAPRVVPFKRRYNHSDGIGSIFHRGVRCDGCGVHPITGPRFKSKVKEDYDLCSICFADMGNEVDFIRMDRPVSNRQPLSFKGFYDPIQHIRGRPPTLPQVFRGSAGRSKIDSRFIQDVNILDGTIMAPSTQFTKIWRMRNNGTVVWPRGTQLLWIGGDRFSKTLSAELEIPADGLPVEKEIDIAIDFSAPEHPGRYVSFWRMASPSGQKFGQRVWVLIQVGSSLKDSLSENVQGFNLNLPPLSSGIMGPQIVNVSVEPMVEEKLLDSDNSNRTTELVQPVVDALPNKDQELNFPINDTLLVGGAVSNPAALEASSSPISYPVVDFSEVALIATSPAQTSDTNVLSSVEEVTGKDEVEQTLLKELEEMGFKQVDLNKEILRMNEYNLEQSVDDLCGVAEWDPILEELQEMGFCDKEMNKMLLKKNNGSIKRVVMDLIAGEKV